MRLLWTDMVDVHPFACTDLCGLLQITITMVVSLRRPLVLSS